MDIQQGPKPLTAQKIEFPMKDFFSKCGQIRSHLLKKSLMENFISCVVPSLIPNI